MKIDLNTIKSSLTGLAFAVTAFSLQGCSGNPPYEEITRSTYLIKEAQEDGARQLAPLELRNASMSLEKAQAAMQEEEYEQARNLATQAAVEAELAKAKTEALKRQQSAGEIEESNRILKEELKRYQPGFE